MELTKTTIIFNYLGTLITQDNKGHSDVDPSIVQARYYLIK